MKSKWKMVLGGSAAVAMVIALSTMYASNDNTYLETPSGKKVQKLGILGVNRIDRPDPKELRITRSASEFDFSQEYDVCTVGAGLSGSVLAERYATLKNARVLVMDQRDHIAGNCFDYYDKDTGILMNLYGAHLFHTNYDRVYEYITQPKFKNWSRWDHEVLGWIDGKLLPIPVNINTVNALYNTFIKSEEEMKAFLAKIQVPCNGECKNGEEMAMSRVGKKLYEKIFKTYTMKQWNKSPAQLDALVTARIPVRSTWDPRYFADKFQALPSEGYTAWFQSVLSNPKIDVLLNTDFFKVRSKLKCKKIFYTGPIDQYFANAGLGKLEYRSIVFEAERFMNVGVGTTGFFQSNSVVNYPGPEVDFTRIVEYKHYLAQESKHTLIVKEYSTDKGDQYYPVPNPTNQAAYQKYQELAQKESAEKGIYFVGRLANYKYFNMDQAIENALKLFEEVEKMPNAGLTAKVQKTSDFLSDSI